MFRQKRTRFETEKNKNYRDQKQFNFIAAHPLSNSTCVYITSKKLSTSVIKGRPLEIWNYVNIRSCLSLLMLKGVDCLEALLHSLLYFQYIYVSSKNTFVHLMECPKSRVIQIYFSFHHFYHNFHHLGKILFQRNDFTKVLSTSVTLVTWKS